MSLFIGFTIKNSFFKYDVFLSAPMSGFEDDAAYEEFREICLEVVEALEDKCGFSKVYYAGRDIPNPKVFNLPKVALNKDIKALRSSKRFILILPGRVYSGSLFECGFAFRKEIQSIYFVQSFDDLPWMMKQLHDTASFVSIERVKTLAEVPSLIRKYKNDLFKSITNKVRLCELANHNLNRLLDKPGAYI